MEFKCKRCGRCCKYPCRFGPGTGEVRIAKQLANKKSIIALYSGWYLVEFIDRFTGVCAFFMGNRCAVFDSKMHSAGCEMSHGVQTNIKSGRWSDAPDSIEVVSCR